ncbi:High-affinity glucose transporter [Grifola frondosa]|uniref:High-affinity glucose transporter n=1 Tax=Grifola frondosa TaxID=5627 RepID=A0A1C7M7W0_GRIFR|nr:High-affinity glucose transporter [Grifola frondosa]
MLVSTFSMSVGLSKIPTLRELYGSAVLKAADTAKLCYQPRPSLLDRVSLYQGDITKLKIDSIVNAANRSLLGGGGVDGAIHAAAGPQLLEECRTLDGCATGDAKITKGYDLPSGHRSLQLTVENSLKHVGFPSISTGIYGYPVQDATHIALNEVRQFLETADGDKLERVIFVVWSDADKDVYETLIHFSPLQYLRQIDSWAGLVTAASQLRLRTRRGYLRERSAADFFRQPPKCSKDRFIREMGRVYNIFIAVFCAIGSFLFGYDSGIISSVITFNAFKSFVNNPGNYDSLSGAVVSTFTGGCFFGAALAGWANDKIGRKRTIQLGAFVALWGCAMQSGANNFACMIIGRIVAGFAIGILSMTVPLYNTEIAPPRIRGFIVGLAQQMIGIGFIVANWVGYGCQFINGNTSWRLSLGLQLAPAFLLLVGSQWMPYSPRWLLEQGRDEEARAVVHLLHGDSAHASEEADLEFTEMQETIKAELAVRSRRLSDLWATRGMLKRTLVAVGVQVFGQFSGINVINYFGPSMYTALGLSHGQSLLVQGIYGAIGPIANFFFITLILDTVGRKKPLMFGAGSFVVTYSILTAIVASFPPDQSTNHPAQRAGIAMIFLTSIPDENSVHRDQRGNLRELGIQRVILTSIKLGHHQHQLEILSIFICLNFFDFIVIALFFPETKGRTLEQMAEVFGDEVDVLLGPNVHEKSEDHDLRHEIEKV